MKRYNWARLSPFQVGRYAEYYVKMELTLQGLDIYTSEVDDKGLDFVGRTTTGHFLEFQVKSVRGMNYIFFPKDKFHLRDSLYAAVVVFVEGEGPKCFLIPSTAWLTPNALLAERNYEGKKSRPEWGINVSRKNWELLEQYAFDRIVPKIMGESA